MTFGSSEQQCSIGEPARFSDTDIDDFVALVSKAGKVTAAGLRQRVRNAELLAFLRGGSGELIAVAGLKRPDPAYRRRVAAKSKTALPEATCPFELGWVSVMPGSEGGRSKLLCAALLDACPKAGVFATTGTQNVRMQSTLGKLGFERVGAEWASVEGDETLCLFILSRAQAS